MLYTQLVVEPLEDEALPLQRGLPPCCRPPALRRAQVSHLHCDLLALVAEVAAVVAGEAAPGAHPPVA